MRADHHGDRGVFRAARWELERGLLAPAAGAETVEVETLVIDLKVVSVADPGTLEARRHAGLDLRFERAIHGGEAEARVAAV